MQLKEQKWNIGICVLSLARKADILGPDVRMTIADVPDKVTFARISEIGVREVDFDITSYLENLRVNNSTRGDSGLMKKIFGIPESDTSIRKRANAVGRMVLKRGRFRLDEIQRDEWLTEIGKELLVGGYSENFTIILEDKTKVSNSMLKKTRPVKLKKHANSYSFSEAKQNLFQYYKDLKQEGALGA